MAYFVEDGVEVWRGREAECAFAELSGGEDFGFEEGFGSPGAWKRRRSPGWTLRLGRTRADQSCSVKLLG